MVALEHKPGRVTIINGKEYLFFSGYSYLGLGCNDRFLNLIHEGIREYGVVYPSSRISNTPLKLYSEWEEKLGQLTGTQDCAMFSSGFLSARTATEIVASEMKVYYKYPAHPASSNHHQAIAINKDWNSFFEEQLLKKEYRFGILADSINPTPGCFNDFNFLKNIPSDFEITLVLDDSHGIGWLGIDGEGIISRLQLSPNIDLLLNFSLSKAYHLNAGAVCGSTYWVQKAKEHVNFTTSTPPMPALAHAFIFGELIFKEQRKLLQQNIDYLRKLISPYTFVTNEETPVFVIHKTSVDEQLLQQHILISSFGYPRPENNKVNRVVVNALHLSTDLEHLKNVLTTL